MAVVSLLKAASNPGKAKVRAPDLRVDMCVLIPGARVALTRATKVDHGFGDDDV